MGKACGGLLIALAIGLVIQAGPPGWAFAQEASDPDPILGSITAVRILGEILPKPELIIPVTATMWGKIYLEEGVYQGAKVKKDQPLARTVLELPANERLPLNDRTIDIKERLEIVKEKARIALEDYRRAVEIAKQDPAFELEVNRRKKIHEDIMKSLQAVNSQDERQEGVIVRRDPRTVNLTSPIDGYVDEIDFVSGEINPDGNFRQLMTIVNLSTVLVRADVYEKDLKLFRRMPRALVTTDAYPGETFEASFQSIGTLIDPQSRTIPVYYELPNPGDRLKIGLRVRLQLSPK